MTPSPSFRAWNYLDTCTWNSDQVLMPTGIPSSIRGDCQCTQPIPRLLVSPTKTHPEPVLPRALCRALCRGRGL